MFEITLILEGRYLVSFSDYKNLSVELREKRRVENASSILRSFGK